MFRIKKPHEQRETIENEEKEGRGETDDRTDRTVSVCGERKG